VLASTSDGFVSVFDIASGKRLWRERADLWFATGARFSPDGRLVAVGGGQSGAVVLFDSGTGRRDGPSIRAADGFVTSVDFDRSGQTLATSGTDGSARLWDLATGVQLGANLPAVHGGWVAATFFPDGRHLLAASAAGGGTVWDVDPGMLARRACAVAGRSLTHAEWRRFLQRRRYEATCPGHLSP
jgi:WD40 repeat protein